MTAAKAMKKVPALSSGKPNQPNCSDNSRNPSTASRANSTQFGRGWNQGWLEVVSPMSISIPEASRNTNFTCNRAGSERSRWRHTPS